MALTDLIAFFISIFSLIRGYSRGFIRSVTGPFSIIVTGILTYIYFKTSKDIVTSLIFGIVSPLLLTLTLNFLLNVWIKATDRQVRPGFLSCLCGSVLTFIWAWVFIIYTLMLISVLPPWGDKLTAIHDDVVKSATYFIIKPWGNSLFGVANKNADDTAPQPSAQNDIKTLADDPRFQKILQDPEIQDEIKSRDIVQLMHNPKMISLMQEVMSDPNTMKKVIAIYSAEAKPQ